MAVSSSSSVCPGLAVTVTWKIEVIPADCCCAETSCAIFLS